ncbi:MAG TPA: LptE family protein [Cyclobacteriaceae bacterium]|nr:LptE family protein [Cyclobacteriaceae bacterium]
MKSKLGWLLFVCCACISTSCGVYSFQGTTTNAKNISIDEFYNNTDLGPANLGQTFTNRLKDYFIQNTNLSVIQSNGELQLEGIITAYTLTPIAPTSTGDQSQINSASSTRLTITVKANYINTLDESMSFKDKSFSFFKDFSNDQTLADIEEQLIKQIFDQISLDIFNASVANW